MDVEGQPAAAPAPAPAGLLIIDKQQGFTSMDVCAIIRTRLRRAGAPKRIRVGHTGTLDPLATGVLVVLVGKATRLCERLMADEKEYEAVVDMSRRSTSDDLDGHITEVPIALPPGRDRVGQAVRGFVGTIMQRPPSHSAMKVGGRRAYAIARSGGEVSLPPRPVRVHQIDILAYDWPRLTLRIRCGKGTYIRSLARDLGAALSTGGLLASLRRSRVGDYSLAHAKPLSQLPDVLTQADLLPPPPAP